jgi:hypothetical protein
MDNATHVIWVHIIDENNIASIYIDIILVDIVVANV